MTSLVDEVKPENGSFSEEERLSSVDNDVVEVSLPRVGTGNVEQVGHQLEKRKSFIYLKQNQNFRTIVYTIV